MPEMVQLSHMQIKKCVKSLQHHTAVGIHYGLLCMSKFTWTRIYLDAFLSIKWSSYIQITRDLELILSAAL